MVELQQDIGLQQLRLDRRSADGQQRLAGEHGRALRHRPDVAREAEMAQIVQKFLRKQPLPAQIREVFLGKMQVLHIVDDLIQPGADGEAAAVRHLAEKHVEIRDPIALSAPEIAVAHGQLIKIAEHGQVGLGFHRWKPLLRG